MAKKRKNRQAPITVVGAARMSAEGVRTLAESAADAASRAAFGAVLQAIKGARRLVGVTPAKRKTKRKVKHASARPAKRKASRGAKKSARAKTTRRKK